jgi:hypothetical protein
MRHLTALFICAGGLLTAGASQTQACLFGCFTPQTCCYGGGHSTYYAGGYTAGYSPYTSYYAPYTSFYAPVTTYYAPSTTCCPTTACYAPSACCPTGTCGTSGCCPTTACYAPACCPTNCCAACPGGTCAANCCPTGSSSDSTYSVSAPRSQAPVQRVERPQAMQNPAQFVSTPVVDSSLQPKVRTANLQRTVPAAAPSTGWEPLR